MTVSHPRRGQRLGKLGATCDLLLKGDLATLGRKKITNNKYLKKKKIKEQLHVGCTKIQLYQEKVDSHRQEGNKQRGPTELYPITCVVKIQKRGCENS